MADEITTKLNNANYRSEQSILRLLTSAGYGDLIERNVKIGHFYVDFFMRKYNLIIEVHGSWHLNEEERRKDRNKANYLKSKGYRFVVVWYPIKTTYSDPDEIKPIDLIASLDKLTNREKRTVLRKAWKREMTPKQKERKRLKQAATKKTRPIYGY